MWKKYDSSTCGRSVSIAHRLKSSELSRWDWYQECVVSGASISMARAASVVLDDDSKEVVDDLVNAINEQGSLAALARSLGGAQHEQHFSGPASKFTVSGEESGVMLELAKRCASTKHIEKAQASTVRALCSTPSTTDDTDGDSGATEDSGSDNGVSNGLGSDFNNLSGCANYCGYGGYSGHNSFGGYGGFNTFACGGYPYGFNPGIAMLNLHAQQAAFQHMAVAAHFQAMSLGSAQNPFQGQSALGRPARGRAARPKACVQK